MEISGSPSIVRCDKGYRGGRLGCSAIWRVLVGGEGEEGGKGDALEDVGFGRVCGDVGRGVCGDGFVFPG